MLLTSAQLLPTNPHLLPKGPKGRWGLISLILLLLNSKLLTFSLGSNTPDWQSPVFKEALQNLRQPPGEPEALQEIPPSSHPPASLTVPQDTGNTQGIQVTPWGESSSSCPKLPGEVRTQTNPFNGIVTHFFRMWFCSKLAKSQYFTVHAEWDIIVPMSSLTIPSQDEQW